MPEQEIDEKLIKVIKELQQKYGNVGEDLTAHLEGMLYSYYLNYWDYVGVDALLNLQKPKTKYPDEMIFIIYHQITELHFKLIIHALEQIGFNNDLDDTFFIKMLTRINTYWGHLTQSFDVLMSTMDETQFLSFRKALIPSSGFQSIQYRLIELWSTDFVNLLHKEYRSKYKKEDDIDEMFQFLYWKYGATDIKTGKKTLTLMQFEEKYGNLIIRKGNEFRSTNLLRKYESLTLEQKQNKELIEQLKEFDLHANLNWPVMHYKYAVKFLQKGKHITPSTGGTNWKKYLPPSLQKQIFFPDLWTKEELDEWGKEWVEKNILV